MMRLDFGDHKRLVVNGEEMNSCDMLEEA